jgi:hypothetical protein
MNRGTVKVLARPAYVCDTHIHVYIEIEIAAYQKACCRSCIKLHLVNRNVTPPNLEHGGVIVALIRNAAVFTSFSYAWSRRTSGPLRLDLASPESFIEQSGIYDWKMKSIKAGTLCSKISCNVNVVPYFSYFNKRTTLSCVRLSTRLVKCEPVLALASSYWNL